MFVSPRRSRVCFVLNVSFVLKQCFPSLAASSASSASKLQNLWFHLNHLKEPSNHHQTLTMTCRKQAKEAKDGICSHFCGGHWQEGDAACCQKTAGMWTLHGSILTPLTTGHSEGTTILMSPNITCVANPSLSDFYARRLRRFWVSLPLKTADSAPAPRLG